MSDPDLPFDDTEELEPSRGETRLLRSQLEARCKTATIPFEEVEGFEDEDVACRIALPCAREKRWLHCSDHSNYVRLLAIEFENLVFLTGLDAMCSYTTSVIEASVRPLTSFAPTRLALSRLLPLATSGADEDWETFCIELTSAGDPATTIRLSRSTNELRAIVGGPTGPSSLSLKVTRPGITTHDGALELLRRVADALFLQIDLLTDIPLSLARDRRVPLRRRPRRRAPAARSGLEFPRNAYESAPVSLYWYARSAVGMPLLQFLAYYQVIEYFYPVYSQAEAHRKLKSILKSPTFRSERDSDISRVLAAIHVTRSGAYGDERSQLKATLTECVDPDVLRNFLIEDAERKAFLSSKTKGLTDHKLPIETVGADLRSDVAERLYEIRCKIVHTKVDSRTGELELLLPFSKEAEQLSYDIELAQFLAQQVLIASSTPFSA